MATEARPEEVIPTTCRRHRRASVHREAAATIFVTEGLSFHLIKAFMFTCLYFLYFGV